MRKISILLAILMLFSCIAFSACSEASEKAYKNAQKLIAEGNYEEAYNLLNEFKTDEKCKELFDKFTWAYGKMVKINHKGETYETHTYTYNNKGYLTKYTEDSRSLGEYTTEYTYDNWGYLIKEVETKDNDAYGTTEYIYNDRSNLIKKTETQTDGTVYTYNYTYDDKDNLIKSEMHFAGTLISYITFSTSTEYSYDDNGNKIKEVYICEDLDVNNTTVYTYDDNKLIKSETTNSDGEVSATVRTYDSMNNLIKKVTTNYKGEVEFIEYIYDLYNNLIKESETRTNGDVFTVEYSDYKLYYNMGN